MPAIYGSLPAFAELYILKSYRRKNVNDFFRTDRTALKRNFLHLNGKLRAALLRGLFCLNEKAEEAVAPPAEIYLNYHLCRMRIFPLPRIKRICSVWSFCFPRAALFPRAAVGIIRIAFFRSFRWAALFALPARLSFFLSLKFYRASSSRRTLFRFCRFLSPRRGS